MNLVMRIFTTRSAIFAFLSVGEASLKFTSHIDMSEVTIASEEVPIHQQFQLPAAVPVFPASSLSQ
jgi:hypothetical protein